MRKQSNEDPRRLRLPVAVHHQGGRNRDVAAVDIDLLAGEQPGQDLVVAQIGALRVLDEVQQEERFLLTMAESAREPVGSMGDDSPPAFLSDPRSHGPHVDEDAMARAAILGADTVLPRSRLFKSIGQYLPRIA